LFRASGLNWRARILGATANEEAAIQHSIASNPDMPEANSVEMAELRLAHEMLPIIFGDKSAGKLMRRQGRPALLVSKVAVKMRNDQDVIDAFRA
jgi:uncharacterized protein (DUF4415 family)